MSHEIYALADRAIREGLHVVHGRTWSGSPGYKRVFGIDRGNILLLNADCGRKGEEYPVTPEEFSELCGGGEFFYRRVGMWSFEPADDPAADLIAYAHRCPAAVGRQLFEARQRIAELEAKEPNR